MRTDKGNPGKPLAGQVGHLSGPRGDNWPRLTEAVEPMIQQQFGSLMKRQSRLFRQALNEAAALAWWTGFPHLLFPTLAVEKIEALARWDAHQRAMLFGDREDFVKIAA